MSADKLTYPGLLDLPDLFYLANLCNPQACSLLQRPLTDTHRHSIPSTTYTQAPTQLSSGNV